MRPLLDLGQKERRLTETMSETSEGTSTTATSISGKSSIDNVEELRDLAAALGVADPDDLLQERFRVDRRKLEQMLLGEFFINFLFSLLFLENYSQKKIRWFHCSFSLFQNPRWFSNGKKFISKKIEKKRVFWLKKVHFIILAYIIFFPTFSCYSAFIRVGYWKS